MNIVSLKVENFRSFEGFKNTKTILRKGINVIVGENNVGKSSLLRALQIVCGQKKYKHTDIFNMEGRRELIIELGLYLDQKDMRDFLSYIAGNSEYLRNSKNLNRFVNDLGKVFFLKFSSKKGASTETRSIRFLSSTAFLIRSSPKKVTNQTKIDDFFKDYSSNPKLSISGYLRAKESDPSVKAVLKLQGNPTTFFEDRLRAKLKVISEIRKRPYGPSTRVNESLDGGEVASVLFTLKNGRKNEVKKFEKIKADFNVLFPNLNLDVRWADDNRPLIFIEKIPLDHQVPIENVGAGIGEIIILLTLLTEAKGLIIGLDLPEMQFHPQSQRLLLKVLEEHAIHNQIIVVTHSPMLINPKKLENITIVREQNGRSFLSQLPPEYFDSTEKVKLERLLLNNSRDFFFSRTTLIVEGPTETGAMPVFSEAMNVDFDAVGISLVKMDGNHFGLWEKLLSGFDIPHATMCDKDALLHIEGSIKCGRSKVKTSPVFCSLMKAGRLSGEDKKELSEAQIQIIGGEIENYPDSLFNDLKSIAERYNVFVLLSDFEGVLKDNGFEGILVEARSISRSKAIQGRFVAARIIAKSKNVPSDFVAVINKVKELAIPVEK